MGNLQSRLAKLRLFVTAEYACSYLPNRLARNLVADPLVMNANLYSQLAKLGFRRSGGHVYRPHCLSCAECLSLRVAVSGFSPNRSQQRTWKKNQDLRVRTRTAGFYLSHYKLFERYVKTRHRGGGMDEATPENYMTFILSSWSHTLLYEFLDDQRLLAVAVVDQLADGLSAVYTFFDPDEIKRSLGTYAVLWQIAEAQRLGLPWVYLGYWIADCSKMAYKINFNPHQVFRGGQWVKGS